MKSTMSRCFASLLSCGLTMSLAVHNCSAQSHRSPPSVETGRRSHSQSPRTEASYWQIADFARFEVGKSDRDARAFAGQMIRMKPGSFEVYRKEFTQIHAWLRQNGRVDSVTARALAGEAALGGPGSAREFVKNHDELTRAGGLMTSAHKGLAAARITRGGPGSMQEFWDAFDTAVGGLPVPGTAVVPVELASRVAMGGTGSAREFKKVCEIVSSASVLHGLTPFQVLTLAATVASKGAGSASGLQLAIPVIQDAGLDGAQAADALYRIAIAGPGAPEEFRTALHLARDCHFFESNMSAAVDFAVEMARLGTGSTEAFARIYQESSGQVSGPDRFGMALTQFRLLPPITDFTARSIEESWWRGVWMREGAVGLTDHLPAASADGSGRAGQEPPRPASVPISSAPGTMPPDAATNQPGSASLVLPGPRSSTDATASRRGASRPEESTAFDELRLHD